VVGDQIRINRPGHKYRMTVEVGTPWLAGDNASDAATTALKAAGLPGAESVDTKGAFMRK